MNFRTGPGPGYTLHKYYAATIDTSSAPYYMGGYSGWLQYYVGATDNFGNTGYSASAFVRVEANPCIR